MAEKLSLTTNGDMWNLELDSDPSIGVGFDAPIGSEAYVNEGGVGSEWYKYGPNPTDWRSDAKTIETITTQVIPAGGTTGQIFRKNSNVDFDGTWHDQLDYAGFMSYITPTDNGDGTITVASNVVCFYQGGTFGHVREAYNIAGTLLTPTDQNESVIVAYWNGGTPIFTLISDESLLDSQLYIPYSIIFRAGVNLHTEPYCQLCTGMAERIVNRLNKTRTYERETGLDVSLDGTNPLIPKYKISQGVVWRGISEIALAQIPETNSFFNCTVANGSWSNTFTAGGPLVNNSQYNPATGPTALTAGYWTINDIYRGVELQLHTYRLLSTQQFATKEDALASAALTVLPILVSSHAMPVARIIVQQGETNIANMIVQSAFEKTFSTSSSVGSHNSLFNIQGGNQSERFHVLAADVTKIGLMAFSTIAGRSMLGQIQATNRDYLYQPFLGQEAVSIFKPIGNSTTVTALGMAATANGTATSRNIATTNLFNMMKRIGYVSSATAGNACGLFKNAAQEFIGNVAGLGGFFFVCRFGISDAAAVANGRLFVGLTSATANLANGNPTALFNILGVGANSGASTLSIMYNDGSGTATSIATDANFPANTRNTDMYEIIIFAKSNGTTVYFQLTNLTNGAIFTTETTTNIPLNTQLLSWQAWRNNGTTALAVGLDIASVYLETDN
jgi:hypothetical protein